MATRLEQGMRTGWLLNYHPTTELPDDTREDGEGCGEGVGLAALVLHFQGHDGDTFYVNMRYHPYLFVQAVQGREREVELGLVSMFGPQRIHQITAVEKEDLDLVNHLSGRKRTYLKLSFYNVSDLTTVRAQLDSIVKRNVSMSFDNPLLGHFQGSLRDAMAKGFEDEQRLDPAGSTQWVDWVQDIREYDVKYHMRVAIDLRIFCGVWYDVAVNDGLVKVERCDDTKYAPAMPRVVAFDIETTKAPLKFPQPEVDQIYLISYMMDGVGYLIVNRAIVGDVINKFDYKATDDYFGTFHTFNETDEKKLLERFFNEMRDNRPNVYVTYNGDYFDFPFIHARAMFHGLNMRKEIGFAQGADGAFVNQQIPHLDCFYWVKRDSYLPQGSQGLKAVTKCKLGFNPMEVDPEEMLGLAQRRPQQMASYAASDALSTWFLYLKYVHPFIFSLATIIPMPPDDVLRKGSGGLCESLLMVQAEANNVIFPNKKEMTREKFYEGHLIDTETYIGGRVEALRSGVYRSDLPMHFNMNPDTYQSLIDGLDDAIRFALEVENDVKVDEVTNYEEVKDSIRRKLEHLRDNPKLDECPLIYHLDVGAMYPNIILTNRLQPYAIAQPDVCAHCCFNTPNNEHQCQRTMSWKWRGELFTAGRYEFQRVKAQLENESFTNAIVEQANLAAVQKKAYGNRKGNVLEGTAYEKKDEWKRRGKGAGGFSSRSGYRQENKQQQRESADARISIRGDGSGSEDEDEDDDGRGIKAYHKLNENTQFNMLKKRLAEYSRKAYGKIHEAREVMRSNVVCQRENSFYVDTVRLFRDRRYEYKAALKKWKQRLAAAKDFDEETLCKSRCVQMESLQLAHKCILNSFYGYVMRKGSRWSSMEMAGIVTYLGATLIQMARALVQHIGVTLELDTDGIWCCLPCTFPENFTFTSIDATKPKISISYPCVVLNKMVHDRYSNHQYQDMISPGVYRRRSECSIYFEVDGPYLAMLLPASREEGKGIKKRYAVFHPNGDLAELKGFELKRRGELMLIKDFQSEVFSLFLKGSSLAEAYAAAATAANPSLAMLESKGFGYETTEILDKITESSNMARRLAEYPEAQKSLAITTARRIAEFLGPQMVKDKGLACQFIISRLPAGRPVTERAIPVAIFRADPAIRAHFLRKWTSDSTLSSEIDLAHLLDWDYYTVRFNSCVQKIITIPAALQNVPNPVPRVPHPDWLHKRIQQQNSRFRQTSLLGLLSNKKAGGDDEQATTNSPALQDMEDLVRRSDPSSGTLPSTRRAGNPPQEIKKEKEKKWGHRGDWPEDDDRSSTGSTLSEDDMERLQREQDAQEEAEVLKVKNRYFTARSTQILDSDFFGADRAKKWLRPQKQAWLHRVRLRKEMEAGSLKFSASASLLAGNASTGPLHAHFIDVKTKALAITWNIIEVRESLDGTGAVTVIVALEKVLYTFLVNVPRFIIADVNSQSREVIEAATEVTNRVLPRSVAPGRLLLIEIPPGAKGEEKLNHLRINEDVRQLYETHITRVEAFTEAVGCCAHVKSQLHLQNTQKRPLSQRDWFSLEELESTSSVNYLQGVAERFVFVFHASADTRGVLAVVNQQTSEATVVFVQPAAATRPVIPWAALCEEAAKLLNASAPSLHVKMEITSDPPSAWRIVHQTLVDATESSKPPLLAVLQSVLPTRHLLQQRFLPINLPYLRILGAAEDEKLFSDPFRWTRLLARRLLQRYFASALWVEERVALSRIASIPVCNVEQDSCVHALDVLFARALHRRLHLLWCSSDPSIAFSTVNERPRQVVMPGAYNTWCVEFSLSRLDVVAVLFSQMIQEGDDPSAHALCDRGVTSHFNILRELIASLLGQAVQSSVADSLLSNVARWLRDPVSRCYEPRLVEMLSGLAHRALTGILIRLAKLGGRTVKVDSCSVMVLTPKYSLQEAISFAQYVTGSLQDQPMMILLALQPVRYWCPILLLDRFNGAGFFLEAEQVLMVPDGHEPSVSELTSNHLFTIIGRLPHKVRKIFVDRIMNTLSRVSDTAAHVRAGLQRNPSVALAIKGEEFTQRLLRGTQQLFDHSIQADVMDEVHQLMETRDLYSTEEREAAAATGHGHHLLSSGALALEYTKCLSRVLELVPCMDAVGKMRNNCVRLCGVSPFSPEARLDADPLDVCRIQSTTCNFCNAEICIDLAMPRKSSGAPFPCPECRAPILASAVEAHLVRRVNQIMMSFCEQDFICSKCREVAASYIFESCCGPLIGKEQGIQRELQALKHFAELQQFAWLTECVDTALECS